MTKLLPAGSDDAVRQVLAAVGWPFLQRLLLPLRRRHGGGEGSQGQGVDGDDDGAAGADLAAADLQRVQQQQLSAALGLSVLSSACRLPEVAAGDDLLSLTPLLLSAAAAGGTSRVLAAHGSSSNGSGAKVAGTQPAWADAAADAAAAADALECLLACASGGDGSTMRVLLESDAPRAAVQALQSALAALDGAGQTYDTTTPGDGGDAEVEAAAVRGSALQAVALSVQLLATLLAVGGSSSSSSSNLGAERTAAAIMLLSRVFGSDLPGALTAAASAPRLPGVDPAALQLQAQHALLLLLPLPISSDAAAMLKSSAEALAECSSGNNMEEASWRTAAADLPTDLRAAALVAGGWPAALQLGVLRMLQSRVGAVQRHSALRVAAAAVDLVGPGWLLPRRSAGGAGGNAATALHQQQQQPVQQQLLTVLMELLAVETPLLLSDAMNPSATVPHGAPAAAAAVLRDTAADDKASAGLTGTIGSNGSRGCSVMDVDADAAGSSEPTAEPLSARGVFEQLRVQERDVQQQQQPGDGRPPGFAAQPRPKSLSQQLAELSLPVDRQPGPGEQVAGERAAERLPSCLQLLEACLEVMVQQAALLETLDDVCPTPAHAMGPSPHRGGLDAPPPGGASATALDGATGGARPAAWGDVYGLLPAPQLTQLLLRMHQVAEILLEFLEAATAPGSDVDRHLALGACRLLGRFLADAPDAHAARVRPLLPALLTLRAAPAEEACLVGGGVSGAAFLLPALLSWTSPVCEERSLWAAALLDAGAPQSLEALIALMQERVAQSVRAVPVSAPGAHMEDHNDKAGDDDDLELAEAGLGAACVVLQQLLSALPHTQALQQSQQSTSSVVPAGRAEDASRVVGTGCQDTHLIATLAQPQQQLLWPLLSALCEWGAVRQQQHAAAVPTLPRRDTAGGATSAHDGVTAATAFLAGAAAARVDMAVLLPAAALLGAVVQHLAGSCGPLLPTAGGSALGTAADTAVAAAAAAAPGLIAWGAEAGWSYALLAALIEEEGEQIRDRAGQSSNHSNQDAVFSSTAGLDVAAMLLPLRNAWEAAELSDVWDAILSSAADSLLGGSLPGLGTALRSAAWLGLAQRAAADADAGCMTPRLTSVHAVMQEYAGLQLLARASRQVLGALL